VILTDDGPTVIDVNPRLVEPGTAWAAGVDLVGALLAAGADDELPAAPIPVSAPDVATHQLLIAVLGAAQHGRGRRGVAEELLAAARRTGDYRDSTEELTPLAGDPLAAVPVVAAAAATLVAPTAWRWFSSGSVSSYALSPRGWDLIRAAVAGGATP
jgi:hypothetical protein